MMTLGQLSRRFLRRQWKRTLFTSLGIIMATALLAGVALLFTSFIQMFVATEQKQSGSWHYHVSGLTTEQAMQLSANIRIDDAQTIALSKYAARLDGDDWLILRDVSQLKNGLAPYQFSLVTGRLPEAENEIALNMNTTENFPDVAIGETIELALVDYAQNSGQAAITRAYTVVGILGWMSTQLPDPVYFALTRVPAAEQAGAEVYLTVRTAASFEKQISDALLDVLPDQAELINDRDALRYGVGRYADDISGLGKLRLETHDSLLRYLGQSSFDQTNSELQLFIGLLMLIILVSVIFVIRNSFAMSVSERISEFGLLRVAGGSPAQIRRLVMQDALHLAIFSIPLGILAGLLAMQITLSYVSGLEVAYIENLRLVVSPWPLAAAAGLSLAAILLAALSPAIRAGRLSPMEAVRKTDSYHLETSRRKKGRSRRPALLGAASQLAGRSVHRDRRRFRNTSLSVGISVLLFLAAGGISLMFSSQLDQYGSETVDFKLSAEAAQTFVQPEILADAAKRVRQIAQVSRTASYGHFYMNADLQPDQFTGELTEAFQRLSAMYGQSQSNEAEMRQRMVSEMSNVRVIAADASLIDSLNLPDSAMIAGKLSQGEALLCQLAVFSMNGLGAASIPMTTIKPGDTLSLLPTEVYDNQAEEMANAISLPDHWKIAAELTELPWFVEGFFTGSPSLILIVDRQYLAGQYQNPDPERYEFSINESLAVEAMDGQEPVVQKTLSDMYPAAGSGINQGLVIQDNYADQKMARNLLLIINIFVYGFTTVIVLICSMNILNTVTTNVMLRRRELAMLQAVGMSRSQVGRMLFLECSLYGLTGAFWGSIFGIGLLYLLGRSIEGTISGMTISAVPWVLVSLTFAGALLIALLSGVLPIRRVMQDNVVEAIRAQE